MPTYCYLTKCGKLIEKEFPLGAAKKRITTEHGTAFRSIASENKEIGHIVSDDDLVARRKMKEFMTSDAFKRKESSGQYIVSDKYQVVSGRTGDEFPTEEKLLPTTEMKLQKLQKEIKNA